MTFLYTGQSKNRKTFFHYNNKTLHADAFQPTQAIIKARMNTYKKIQEFKRQDKIIEYGQEF